jgi:hypothetical protein
MRRLLAFVVLAGCSEVHQLEGARAIMGDLVPARLAVPQGDALVVDTAPVAHARAVDPDRPLEMRATPRPDRSRRYWTIVSGTALADGLDVHTTAPGATISLRPQTDAREGIDPNGLVLVDPEGAVHRGHEGMHTTVAWDELRAGASPFVPGTSAFRLDPALGDGTWTVRTGAPLAGDVLVHVVEPDSALELTVTTDTTTYLAGHTVVIDVEARDDETWADIDGAIAHARSPTGDEIEVELDRVGEGRMRGRFVPDALDVVPGTPWLVEVEASIDLGDATARRNARVSFGYGVAAAGFDGRVELEESPRAAPLVALGVDVVAPGRYAAVATVWGLGPSGTAQPLGVVQSAAWLDVGDDAIDLPLGDLLDGAGDRFELRDLRLVDQSRVALLHRQALGATLQR